MRIYKGRRARKAPRCHDCGRVMRRAEKRHGQGNPKRRFEWSRDHEKCQFMGA